MFLFFPKKGTQQASGEGSSQLIADLPGGAATHLCEEVAQDTLVGFPLPRYGTLCPLLLQQRFLSLLLLADPFFLLGGFAAFFFKELLLLGEDLEGKIGRASCRERV